MNIKIMILTFAFLFPFFSCSGTDKEEVEKPIPEPKEKYTVKVRSSSDKENWKTLDIKTATIDLHEVRTTYFTQFDMSSPVEVMVAYGQKIDKVNIRPTNKGIDHTQKGDTIYFNLNTPTYLSIEFNDDRFGNLQLFADHPKKEVPKSEENVMYFGPGLHERVGIEAIDVPSNTIVYIDTGAIVTCGFKISNAENVQIIGRGIIKGAKQGISIEFSNNIHIEGVTILNPEHYSILGGQSTNITIENLKSFSSKIWSDGIDVMSCSDMTIDNVYMRNSDDCIAIYGHRWAYWGDSRNIKVLNSILWADNAHPINIGSHGNMESENGEMLEGYIFKNIDILEHHEKTPIYQGCFAITCGDNNTVRDLLFEDIRVENIEEGSLFYFAVQQNVDFNTIPGKKIEDITVRNVSYAPEYPQLNKVNKAVIKGFDNNRKAERITIENVSINGKKLSMEDIETNEFVGDIIIE